MPAKKAILRRPAKNLEDTRMQVKNKFKEISPEQQKKMNNFEIAIYNYSIKHAVKNTIPRTWDDIRFRRIYLNKVRSIIANLKRDPELLSLKALDVVSMEHQKMAPEVWQDAIRSAQKKRDMMVIPLPKISGGLYQCRCRSRNTSFYQMQTRSADEPMTIYITCHDCDNHWKE